MIYLVVLLQISTIVSLLCLIVVYYKKNEKDLKEILSMVQKVEDDVNDMIFQNEDRGAYKPSEDIRKSMNNNNWY